MKTIKEDVFAKKNGLVIDVNNQVVQVITYAIIMVYSLMKGTCQVNTNGISCVCNPGWTGDRCTEIECVNNYCKNEGIIFL